MKKTKYLTPICWISRPHELRNEISESNDLCSQCATKEVERYKKNFPEHSDLISVGGGDDYNHESDSIRSCAICSEPLASYCLDSGKQIYTLFQWLKQCSKQ